jgi:thiamine-phosphate pyrophosphorylase
VLRERLLVITDASVCADVAGAVAAALAGAPRGRVLVQLRDKALAAEARRALGERLRRVTADAGARLVVNSDAALARAIGADGVHLPDDGRGVAAARAELPAGGLLGASTHAAAAAAARIAEGADYVVLGPIWPTPGKAAPIGAGALGEARRAAKDGTIFALGGVDGPARAGEAARAGASGVAVIRAVLAARDPGAAAAALCAAVEAAHG